MAVAREPSPPIAMPHSIQSYQGSSADGGDNESVMSDLSWDGTPDENILSGSSRAATSLAIHEEDEGEPNLRFLDDPDGDHTLIMEDDVYHQLAEMEEKLKMAGEFGNALLEENQELRILNQQAKQETSASIEALEQERHELRMKLETAHTEKENMSYDLRMEVESLRKELANQSEVLKVANSNKQGIIGELLEQKDQNLKLANQLHEVGYILKFKGNFRFKGISGCIYYRIVI
ncbi:bicaudal D-related protein homolog [Lytechinus pictus]|uniref:bicaudal D-related protein homolog n=1 Tax=Lytechinus pictus TaxID=7653 RepID=UPI00240E4122|nr:bicaudal D-related protein homolog [Lytechinus pictus]